MLRKTLSTIHLFGVIIRIGFDQYELLLHREMHKVQDTAMWAPLIAKLNGFASRYCSSGAKTILGRSHRIDQK